MSRNVSSILKREGGTRRTRELPFQMDFYVESC